MLAHLKRHHRRDEKGRNRTCRIVLIGAGIKEEIERQASGRNAAKGWEQLHSRLKFNWLVLSDMAMDKKTWAQECRAIAGKFGITDKTAIDWLVDNASNYRELEQAIAETPESVHRHNSTVEKDSDLVTEITSADFNTVCTG